MMRRRRASATIALCLLASAMTTCAQCGWVLWEISSPTTKNPDRTYDKIDAEATTTHVSSVLRSPFSAERFKRDATARPWRAVTRIE
jgi:hypothetical protein